jgi:hypothetical protein
MEAFVLLTLFQNFIADLFALGTYFERVKEAFQRHLDFVVDFCFSLLLKKGNNKECNAPYVTNQSPMSSCLMALILIHFYESTFIFLTGITFNTSSTLVLPY